MKLLPTVLFSTALLISFSTFAEQTRPPIANDLQAASPQTPPEGSIVVSTQDDLSTADNPSTPQASVIETPVIETIDTTKTDNENPEVAKPKVSEDAISELQPAP